MDIEIEEDVNGLEELNISSLDAPSSFSWENRYAQSWEVLKEDASGTLQPTLDKLVQRESEYLSRRRAAADAALRRGIMRHIVFLLDWSFAASTTEVTPNRGAWVVNNALRPFIREFYEQNPLSQLSIVVLRDGLAEKLTDLSPNATEHENALDRLVRLISEDGGPKGDLSLKNGLEVSRSILSHVPGHGSREIIFLQQSLSSIDFGNIFDTIPELVQTRIHFNAISFSGEVAVTRRIAKETRGSFSVSLNDGHFLDLVKEMLTPPPVDGESRLTSYLVQMGFPMQREDGTLCVCHGTRCTKRGFECPRCKAFVCQIPTDCPICRLTLISAPHLAKSYHHLFPVPTYESIQSFSGKCFACDTIDDSVCDGYNPGKCIRCEKVFCSSCNLFIHNTIYNCPGCLIK